MIRIAIFASGSGSNAGKIVEFFRNHPHIRVEMIFCNNPKAYVIERAALLSIPCRIFKRDEFYHHSMVENELIERKIDWIVLAGFLWLVPQSLIKLYSGKIINIHPALLPAYGGKGMYGKYVHEAVIAAGDSRSGISIHLVDEEYDRGKILFQAECIVKPDDTPDRLAERIHQLEHQHYPKVIETAIMSQINLSAKL